MEYIAEKLHLGGHALRQRRTAAINNAYAHCVAMCEKDCTFYWLSRMALSADSNTALPSGSKDDINAIIDEAKASGGYHSLSSAQQDILVKALQDHHDKLQLLETTRPSVQLHNVRTTFSLIHHKVCYIRCNHSSSILTPIFVAPECPSMERH